LLRATENTIYRPIIERTVIDITQLGCPPLTDISLPAISSTFTCNKSKHVCALRTAYSLADWLNFHILTLQYEKWPPQPEFHLCIPDDCMQVTSAQLPPQRATKKYVSIYFNADNLDTEVKIGTSSSHTVLNEMQWFILVTFKGDMP